MESARHFVQLMLNVLGVVHSYHALVVTYS